MGENSSIQWTHHTFNPWIGCQRVSPGCVNCYAEALDARWRPNDSRWGPSAARTRTSKALWSKPFHWNKRAALAGVRERVFCASLADVFEDRAELAPWRADLFKLVKATPHLDWLLLTKRPENAQRLWVGAMMDAFPPGQYADGDLFPVAPAAPWLPNIWLGTTVEDQKRADQRVPVLLGIPVRLRFLSVEPQLGPVDLTGWGDAAPSAEEVANAPARWEDMAWPEFVPLEVRRSIASFWGPSCGRGPAEWLRDHVSQRVPRTGAVVTAQVRGDGWATVNKMSADGVVGRYVHCWNNIGRVITSDGRTLYASGGIGSGWTSRWLDADGQYRPRIHWVIQGGESGPGARPFDVEWARNLAAQCERGGAAYFLKQLGRVPIDTREHPAVLHPWKLQDGHGGTMSEWPADLQALGRAFPVVAPSGGAR